MLWLIIFIFLGAVFRNSKPETLGRWISKKIKSTSPLSINTFAFIASVKLPLRRRFLCY
jgi:hypothetical protein